MMEEARQGCFSRGQKSDGRRCPDLCRRRTQREQRRRTQCFPALDKSLALVSSLLDASLREQLCDAGQPTWRAAQERGGSQNLCSYPYRRGMRLADQSPEE